MRILIISIVCWLGYTSVQAQLLDKDSLLNILPGSKEDTQKVYLLYSIADQYESSDPATAKYYIGLAGALSQRLRFETGILKYNRHLAYIHAYQANYDSMLYFSTKALELARIRKDTFNIGVSLFNIGEAYKFMSDYEKGLEFTLEGVQMLQGKGYANIESNLYGGLQGTYLMLKQFDKAIGYGLKAIELGRKLEDKSPLMSALVNLANAYGEIAKYSEAKLLYSEALELATKTSSHSIEAMVYEGLSDIALQEGNYEKIKQYAEKALALNTGIQNAFGQMAAQQALGIYYLLEKKFVLAAQHTKQALQIAEKENYLEAKAEVINTLAALAFATQDFKAAFLYADDSKRITEKIFTASVAEQDARWRVKYETEKKDKEIQLQKALIQRKTAFNSILVVGAASLLIVLLLLYRNYRQKQKFQQKRIYELETEKQLTATGAVLKGEEQERTRLAKDLHDGLGGMLSGIKYSFQTMKGNLIMTPENQQAFERSMDMLDSSIREMRRVAHNMMPEALVKFGLDTALKDFCNDINQSGALQVSYQSMHFDDKNIDQTTAIAIYRIIQELINNTMKHAAAKKAIVQVTQTGQRLSITVEDDGKGFKTAILNKAKGMGWSNIQHRVDFLKGTLDVQSGEGMGTSVLIELNF